MIPSRILGVDPGLRVSGYVLLAGDSVEASGVLPNEEILASVLPCACDPGALLAIEEMGGQGRFVGLDELRTVRWSGRFEERWIALCAYRGCPAGVRFVLRSTVKARILGRANGKDAQIRQALIDLWGGEEAALGPKGQKKRKGVEPIRGPLYGVSSHAWSALAVAVTVRDQFAQEAAPAPQAPGEGTPARGVSTSAPRNAPTATQGGAEGVRP